MKKKSILFALAAVCLPVVLSAQQERKITLNEAIAMARVQSVDAAVALNELKTAYWEYRTFRADLLPEVNLTGTLPNYNKSYGSYQNADGSYSFVRNSALGLSGDLSIDQNIWLTGGKLSLVSSLDYMKQLGSGGDRHFMSVPITLKLTQPILGVNNVKWNRRIEPVRYAEAKAAFITATEEVTMRAITYYFNLLLAEENLGTARQNLSNADHLYKVALAKREMGQISENELLQLKLSYGLTTYIVLIVTFNLPFLMEEHHFSSGNSGMMISLFFLAIMAPGFFLGHVVKYLKEKTKFYSLLCIALGLALIWISPKEWLIIPGCILVGLGYGVIQPLIYDKTVDTAVPQKTTLALAFVMAMNYLAVLLCPFIVDFFQSLFHVRSQEFPFIFNLCITILALIWAYRRKKDFLFGDKL